MKNYTRVPLSSKLILFAVIFISTLLNKSFAQTAVTNINANYVDVNDSSNDYNINGYGGTYPTGTNYTIQHTTVTSSSNNLVLSDFSIGADNYVPFLIADESFVQRVDNANVTGNRQVIFHEREVISGTTLQLDSDYVATNEAVFNSTIINRGADNTFANQGGANINNIERIDFVWTTGLATPTPALSGFLVLERGGNDPFKVAPILSIDGSNQPTSYGNLLSVPASNWGDTGNTIQTTVFVKDEADANLRPSTDVGNQNINAVYVSFSDLGIAPNTTVYGYSIIPNDVNTTSHTLTDVTTFPTATSSASGQGGIDLIVTGAVYNADGNLARALIITANDDDFSATTFGSAGGTTSTVFTNDDANGTTPATNALIDNNINISNDDGLIGVVINNNGTIDVPFGATPGTYNVEYQICLTADNTICDTAIATIVIVDDCDALASGNTDTDGDGVSDVCDFDDDNDGILDTNDIDCAPGPLALGQTFADNTGSNFNAEFIPNVYEYGGASVTFGYEPYGGSAWHLSGVTSQNNPGILPDGDYINAIADGTTFPENEHVRFYFNFSEPVYNVNFKVGGLDNSDRADFFAVNNTDNVPVNISDINVGANLTINGQSAVTGPSANANAPSNSIAIQIDGPVTQIIIDVGNQDGNELETVEIQFYEMQYCLPLDTDGDGVIDILDLDSDNDGIYDIDEVGGTDFNNDGQADGAVDANGIPASASGGISPIDTLNDGSFDYQNTDSDGDGCADANEAYGNVTAAGIDGGQFGFPDPANVDTSGLVDLGALVDYDIGTNPSVTDPTINSVCDPCNAISSGNTDTDGDGISDICDEDNDNDGIIDIYEQDCSPGPIALGQTFSDNTGSNFNAEFIPNVYAYGGASVTFGYEPYGGSAWNLSGVSNQNNPAILPDGEYINVIADGTTYPEGEVVRFYFTFSQPVYNVNFKLGGLGDFERADFTATNGSDNLPVNLSDINVGGGLTIANQSAVTGASVDSAAPANSINVSVFGPVTEIIVTVGQQDGDELENVDLQFYEMQYCLDLDTDGDGVNDVVDLDSDNDGIYDIDEAGNGALDTNNDGILDSNDASFSDGDGNGADDTAQANIPVDTLTDGSFDFQNTDSDGDGCPDANEAYDSPFVSGSDGGQFGEPDPASVDSNNGLVTEAGVDYSLGTNSAVTDPGIASSCVINPSITTVKTFTDIDGNALTTEYSAVGEVINYTITLTNSGNVDIYSPTMVDTTADSAPVRGGDAPGNDDGVLNVGETWTYIASHTVTQADLDNGSYTNTAEADGSADTTNDGSGDTPVDNDESETVNAIQSSNFELTKTAAITNDVGPAGASLGDELTYTFSVENTGNVTISNLAIDDALTGSVDLAITPSTLAPGATG
ncbi:beta strand repeat-containing protein, partial [Winogradskyella aquimaris]|nr:hypothetical protein [Winogradskyella aquimaris]